MAASIEVKTKVEPKAEKVDKDQGTRAARSREGRNAQKNRESEKSREARRERSQQREDRRNQREREKQHLKKESQEELTVQQVRQSRQVLERARQGLLGGLRSAVQRALARPGTPDEEKLAQTASQEGSIQERATTVVDQIAKSTAATVAELKSLGTDQGTGASQAPKELLHHQVTRQLIRGAPMGEPSRGSREAQRGYKVWSEGRANRPNVKAMIAKGRGLDEVKRSMSTHLEICAFMMLNIWSLFYRKLQKRFQEYEQNTGDKFTAVPRSYIEVANQIRFSRNQDVKPVTKGRVSQETQEDTLPQQAMQVATPDLEVEQPDKKEGVVYAG